MFIFRKFSVLCFLEIPVLRFALLPYYRRLHEWQTRIWLINDINIQKFIKKKKFSWLVSVSTRLATDILSFWKHADWFKALIPSSVYVGICVTDDDDNCAVAELSLFVLKEQFFWYKDIDFLYFSFSFIYYFILFIFYLKINRLIKHAQSWER